MAMTGLAPQPRPTLPVLAADLAAGRTTSSTLIEEALARIADPAGEGRRTFVKVYADAARIAAEAQDRLRAAGYVASSLAGLPVSIKDLFDVAGEVTLAGSKALDDAPPATADAPIVARLKAAGAVIIGRTNMTEFAFSGVGINPHYGTPGNPHDRSLIPGGSSAGAPEEHTSELQSPCNLVCRLLLEKKKKKIVRVTINKKETESRNILEMQPLI